MEENKIHDTPKPIKKKFSVIERLLSPKSTGIGLVLLAACIYVLQIELDTTVKMSISSVLAAGALVCFGIKDKKNGA